MPVRFSPLPFICLILLLFSCKKENSEHKVNFQNHSPHLSYPFIKSVSSTYDPTVTYYYDTFGRFVSDGISVYTYSGDSVYWNGQPWYILNSSGLVSVSFANSNVSYRYDSLGRLISSMVAGAFSDSCFYQNNNLMASFEQGDTESGQVKYDVAFYSYNSSNNTIGNYNYGTPYLGKSALNLLDSVRTVESYGPPGLNISAFYNEPENYTITRATYTYTFNNLGYVSSCTTTNSIYQDGPVYTTVSIYNYLYY